MKNPNSGRYDFLIVVEASRSFLADDDCMKADHVRARLTETPISTWTRSTFMPNWFTGTLALASATKAEKRDEAMRMVTEEFQKVITDLEADAVVLDIALMVNRLGEAIEWRM
jgi:hypothetical protein